MESVEGIGNQVIVTHSFKRAEKESCQTILKSEPLLDKNTLLIS